MELPPFAAWRHHDAREGFEVVFLRPEGTGLRVDGHTAAVEAGEGWAVEYAIALDVRWRTRRARVRICSHSRGRISRPPLAQRWRWMHRAPKSGGVAL